LEDYERDEKQVSEEAFELSKKLFPLNPEGMLLIDEDKEMAMEPLDFLDEPQVEPVTWFATAPGQDVWDSKDYQLLMGVINEPRTEKIGARPNLHLEVWNRTCGGAGFMTQGLTEAWTDSVKGPATLAKAKRMREYHLDEAKKEALRKCVARLLDERVIVPISYEMAT
jgi:hypothetical protein